MSHRGICLFCGEVIWMGQPMRYLPEPIHLDCLNYCCECGSPWESEWNDLLDGVEWDD